MNQLATVTIGDNTVTGSEIVLVLVIIALVLGIIYLAQRIH